MVYEDYRTTRDEKMIESKKSHLMLVWVYMKILNHPNTSQETRDIFNNWIDGCLKTHDTTLEEIWVKNGFKREQIKYLEI